MAWTYLISSITSNDTTIEVFGQLQFSGNYTTGGDGSGTFQIGGNTAGFPQFFQTSALHAGQAPVRYGLHLDDGYRGVMVPGSGPSNFKLKLFDTATGAELSAAAYPAGITSAGYHGLSLAYVKNL